MPTLDSFVWASAGIEPAAVEDAIYTAGDQPIAGYDNFIMWAVTSDIHALNDYATGHGNEHESGGEQEIDLAGLEIGSQGSLDADGTTVGIVDSNESDVIRYDNDVTAITAMAEVRNGLDVGDLLRAGGDIETYSGTTLFDSDTGWFHRAEQAQDADWANEAGDSELFDGRPIGDFLFGDESETVTEPWTFEPTVDADISGHASTASVASIAEMAEDSELHEGWTVQEILDEAWSQVDGEFTDVQDDGVEVVADASAINAGESIDVTDDGAIATMDVTSVPHADEADWATDSGLLDDWTRQDILDAAYQDIEDDLVDIEDNGNNEVTNARTVDFGTSMDVSSFGNSAKVDVTSVPHADEADDADHADEADESDDSHRLEGRTLSEVLALVDHDTVWEEIGTWSRSGNGWTWNEQLNTVYDRYRLVVHHEGASDGPEQINLRLQVNDDSRSRYVYISGGRLSDGGWGYEYDEGNRAWPIAQCYNYKQNLAEYEVSMPRPMDGDGDNYYPSISTVADHADTFSHSAIERGGLSTNFPSGIDEFTITQSGSFTSYATIQLLGRNI